MRLNRFSFIFVLFLVLFSVNAFAQVSIMPNPAASNADLVCGISGANPAAYIYKWSLNGILQGYTSDTIPNFVTSPLQNWNCQIYVNVPGMNIQIGQASVTITNSPPDAAITSFQNGTEGSTQINLTGTAADNVDFDSINSYLWNFGDGLTSNSQNANHVYLANGTYTVTFSATDSNGGTGTATSTVVIFDRAPVVYFNITLNTLNEGGYMNLTDMTVSYDPIVSWQWYLNGAAILNSTLNITNLRTNNGTYVLNLSMTDIDGSVGSAVKNITINDLSPAANFTSNVTTLNEGQYIELTDMSATPWDSIVAWLWNFGDGATSILQNNSHQYLSNKTFNVNLTIMDVDGSTSLATKTIVVNDIGPFANFTVSTNNTIAGQPITFTSTSYSFPDTIVSYQWIFGAGNATQNYTYSAPGNYSIFLLVTDSDGSTDQAGPTRINVRNAPVLPPRNYSISFSSVQNNSLTTNRGNITFNSSIFALPSQMLATNNTYTLSFTPTAGFAFLRWNATGGARVANNFTASTGLILTGNGSVSAIYYNNSGAPVVHDIRINTGLANSAGTGVRIANSTGGYILTTPAQLLLGDNHTIDYSINNDGTQTETVNLLVYVDSVLIGNHTRTVNTFFTTPVTVFNTSLFTQGLHTISLNVSIIGFPDATTNNNIAQRTINITMIIMPDVTAPSISAINYSGLTNVSAVINWTTNELANTSARYGLTASLGAISAINDNTLLHSRTLTALLPNTTYLFNITSCDVSNNCQVNGTFSFRTRANIIVSDITPPVISLVNSSGLTNVSAVINWTTNELANSTVTYNSITARDLSFVFSHSIILNSLLPNTTYSYNVSSSDVSGNNATSAQFIFRTRANQIIAPPSDTTAPATITNLLVQNKTNSTIRWSWTNPTDLDFNSTLISVNGAPNVTLSRSAVNYTIAGLTPNTVYRVIVLTQDNATIKNINNTAVGNLTRTLSNPILPVFTITNSWINGTFYPETNSIWRAIDSSPISNSRISGSSAATFNADMNITLSRILISNITNSYIIKSRINASNVNNSIITNSNITRCSLVKGYFITNSVLTDCVADPPSPGNSIVNSTIVNATVMVSNITNSNINGGNISNSNIQNSTLINTNVTASNIINTTLTSLIVTNANITNGNITSGNVTTPNGQTYNAGQELPTAPAASFAYSASGLTASFTSTADDANSYENSTNLTYSWNFGDSTTSALRNPSHIYAGAGTLTVSLTVTDTTGINAVYSAPVSVSAPAPPSSGNGGGRRGSSGSSGIIITGPTTMGPKTIFWDITKEPVLLKTMRPIDSIIFDYQGTSYNLIVDKFGTDMYAFKISPTNERRSGIKADTYEFIIKDKMLLISIDDVQFNTVNEGQSLIRLKLALKDGMKESLSAPVVIDKVKNGVIKIVGEISPPKDASVPVGVGISVATLMVGLMLFLGLRLIWS